MQGKGRSLDNSRAALLDAPITEMTAPAWYAIWTRSHAEQMVHDQLQAKGFNAFLPKAATWTMRRGVRQQVPVPLFPGYLFVRHAIDKHSHTEIIKARGVVRVLGERWDRLETIDERVMSGLHQMINSGEPVQAHPRLLTGARVRVAAGPFAGLRGIFVRERSTKGLLVLSIDLLQRSVSVEIETALVEAL